jgi:Cu+-exporting ATPase
MDALPDLLCSYCGVPTSGSKYCCTACQALDGAFAKDELKIDPKHEHLDQFNFRKKYLIKAEVPHFLIHLEGMHCPTCVHLIEKLPDFVSEVQEVRADYGRSLIWMAGSEKLSLAQVATVLESWGYKPTFLKPEEDPQLLTSQTNKSQLKKIAVAGAAAGNIMLFVVPIYSGLEGSWKLAFNWVSFFLFLPILFYSATGFYRGALNSLRYGHVNVDLPITIALLAGFLLSTINLMRGQGEIYFDSTASFIFLILCARFLLNKNQQKFLSFVQTKDFLKNDHFIRLEDGLESVVGFEEIRAGDILQLRKGQISPVDGEIESDEALIDVAILSGEPLPRYYSKGMEILAGSKVLSSDLKVLVTKDAKSSQLSSLLGELRAGSLKKTTLTSITDRWAQRLIIGVFALAAGFFVLYFPINSQEAFNRSLALIILACPCAMAFGAPLALNSALKKAQELGILIRNGDVFERVLKVKNIFFDKTGTLTSLDLRLKESVPSVIPEEIKKIVLSLEQNSAHPVAFAFRKAWPEVRPENSNYLLEELGRGVRGEVRQGQYFLGLDEKSKIGKDISVVLKKNGQQLAEFLFEAPLQDDSAESLKVLREKGYSCFLVSGDRGERVREIGKICGVQESRIFGDLSPEAKEKIVSSYTETCMVGDGTNDARALVKADVGIAVKGSTYANLQAADIFFTREGLKPLEDLLKISRTTKTVLLRNLLFSLAYNSAGAALALTGYVTPWLAAILMPISSFLIIASTLWGFR